MQDQNKHIETSNDKDEHLAVLKDAERALTEAEKNLQEGRERLQNAIDRYKERSANGFIKPI